MRPINNDITIWLFLPPQNKITLRGPLVDRRIILITSKQVMWKVMNLWYPLLESLEEMTSV